MARPGARNRGTVNDGLSTRVHDNWIARRKDSAQSLVAQIRTTVAAMNDGQPSEVASATSGRIIRTLLKKATESNADFDSILIAILDEELAAAQSKLSGNKKQRTLDALAAIMTLVMPSAQDVQEPELV